jgi:sRNA-binding regulator protein Hfq
LAQSGYQPKQDLKDSAELSLMTCPYFTRISICIFALIGGSFLFFLPAQAQKNDTVYLYNGDRITGELKKFENGLLFLKTDAMQTVNIEYDRISTIYSSKHFELRATSGYRYFGTLLNSSVPGSVNIITDIDTIIKPLWDIVQITSIKNRFFQKIDGSVDLGLNYTKASDVFQFSVAASAVHRTANYATAIDLSSIISDQDDDVARNNDAGFSVTRYFPGKWLARAETRGQQNTELDLDYRILAGLGGGYDLVRSNSQRLYSLAGLITNRERTLDSALVSNNLEFVVSLNYKWFRYSHPKIDITSGINFLPSLTTKGRIRLEYDLNGKIEIVKDVFFSITLYENFDNNPAASGASKNDWGIITSIGYTF